MVEGYCRQDQISAHEFGLFDSFDWQSELYFQLNWDHEHTPNDVSFNLGQVRILQNDSIRWDYRISKKIFLRPERVRKIYIDFSIFTLWLAYVYLLVYKS